MVGESYCDSQRKLVWVCNLCLKSMPTGKDSVQVAVIISKDLKEKLKEFAKSRRWSLSQAGAALIEEGIERAGLEAKDKID